MMTQQNLYYKSSGLSYALFKAHHFQLALLKKFEHKIEPLSAASDSSGGAEEKKKRMALN